MIEPTLTRPHPAGMGGTQKIYRFDNGYGASVVNFQFSYGGSDGKWELAVIKYKGDTDKYSIDYSTGITDDVMGYLSDDEVQDVLEQIKLLPTVQDTESDDETSSHIS